MSSSATRRLSQRFKAWERHLLLAYQMAFDEAIRLAPDRELEALGDDDSLRNLSDAELEALAAQPRPEPPEGQVLDDIKGSLA